MDSGLRPLDNQLTVLVPVYNEAATILKLLESVRELETYIPGLEIIVINDGSTDSTKSLLQENSRLYDLLIDRSNNGGKGAAIIEALGKTRNRFVIIQDADLEYDPRDIPVLWSVLVENGAQVVHTNRLSGSMLTRVHYFWHKVGNRIITLLFNSINNTTFSDVYSGYLMFDVTLLNPRELKIKGWGQQAEMLTMLVSRAEKVFELPIRYFGRTYDEGKKIRASATLGVILAICSTRFRVLFSERFSSIRGTYK